MGKKRCVSMLLAGGKGRRLKSLTRNIAKPAVPFGGKYRIIDFTLSNCTNSGIDTVGILTDYQSLTMEFYIGSGSTWDKKNSGLTLLPSYAESSGDRYCYSSTASTVYKNINYIDQFDPDYVLILSGAHIYKMNYDLMIDFHIKRAVDITISVIR